MRQSILGQMVTTSACPRCGGEGKTISQLCKECAGEGRRVEERSYTVDIPAGVANGSTLRLTGRGAVGPRGGGAGDLYGAGVGVAWRGAALSTTTAGASGSMGSAGDTTSCCVPASS